MSHYKSLGAMLRQYRLQAGLTQEALAEQAQLSVYTISNFERGVRSHPRQVTLTMLATALGLSQSDRAALLEVAGYLNFDAQPPSDSTHLSAQVVDLQAHALAFIAQQGSDLVAMRRERLLLLNAPHVAARHKQHAIVQYLLMSMLPILTLIGSCAGARRYCQWGIRASKALDDPLHVKWFQVALGDMHYFLDDWGSAEQAWRYSWRLAQETRSFCPALGKLADLADERDDPTTARLLLEEQLRWHVSTDNIWGIARVRQLRGSQAQRRGEAARADEELEASATALELYRHRFGNTLQAQLLETEVLAVRARLRRDLSAAEQWIRAGLALTANISGGPLTARMLLGQAEFALAMGSANAARRMAHEALQAAQSVGAATYHRRAHRMLQQLGGL